MSHRKKITLLIFVALILLGLGYIFRYAHEVGICPNNNYACVDFWVFTLAHPLVISIKYILVILFALLFFPENVWKSWVKFAIVAISIGIGLIYLSPIYCEVDYGPCFDKKNVTHMLSQLFIAITVILIFIKMIKPHIDQRRDRSIV
ncbi:MAG TPA: hypothetical protein VEC13_02895 [Candidatus Paceibacterota bacterium]|nr:hypothetical protein [Candidatus Paceibacterota bacterium]